MSGLEQFRVGLFKAALGFGLGNSFLKPATHILEKYNLAWKTLTHIQTKCDLQKLVFYIQNEQHLEHKQFQ